MHELGYVRLGLVPGGVSFDGFNKFKLAVSARKNKNDAPWRFYSTIGSLIDLERIWMRMANRARKSA